MFLHFPARGPGDLVSCRVQLQSLSNTPEAAHHFQEVCLRQAGAKLCRTESGHLALEQVTSSRMGTCGFFLHLCLLVICNILHWISAYVTLVKLLNLK